MKTHLNCVIIDDEPLAQNLIEKFIKRVPYLSLLATYDNAITATHKIDTLKPDIIFLDINMPEMTGLEFLRSLVGERPQVIFITAHQQYAYEGFEQDAVDYLLKPVAFGRFMKAIHKVEKRLSFSPEDSSPGLTSEIPTLEAAPSATTSRQDDFFLVKEDKKLTKIAFSEIIYVEGMKDYIKIHVEDRFIITHMTMTKIMEQLPTDQFLRINRSFIICISFIKQLEGNMITMTNGDRLTIGINYRNSVRDTFKKWTL